jgi:hypothetical protein
MSNRPMPPADVNPWGREISRDVDQLMRDSDRLSTNTAAALQAAGTAVNTTLALTAASDIRRESTILDVTIGAGWGSTSLLPTIYTSSVTGRLEINFGGAVRNGSARLCYSISRDGVYIVDREVVRLDFSRCIALTGGATFPASGFSTEIIDVGTEDVIIQGEVYGEAAGVILSGFSLTARPSI